MGGPRHGEGGDGVQILHRGAVGGGDPLLDGLEGVPLTQLTQTSPGAEALHRADFIVAHRSLGVQTDVADLPRVIVGTGVELTVQDQPRTEARAEGAEDHIPCPAPRPKPPLGQSAGVGVVAEVGGKPCAGGELLGDGNVLPAEEVGRLLDDAPLRVHGTAAGDTDGHGGLADGLALLNEAEGGFVDGGLGLFGGGGIKAYLGGDGTVLVWPPLRLLSRTSNSCSVA